MPVLVKFSDNYSDEFDVDGFKLFETAAEQVDWENALREEWAEYSDTEEMELYFGTNEFIYISKEDYFDRAITIKEITHTEYYFLEENFGTSYGMFIGY